MFIPGHQYRKIVFLPVALIQSANEDGWLLSLAYFTRLKSIYRNNTVYNYSWRVLGELIDANHEAVRKHVKILEAHGLIRFSGEKNMTFAGADAIREILDDRTKKLTNVLVDHKNQLSILRGKILQFNLNQQHHSLRKSETIISPSNLRIVSSKERISKYVGVGNYGAGKLIHKSESTGKRLKENLIALGIIQTERVIREIGTAKDRDHFHQLRRLEIFSNRTKFVNGVVFEDRPPVILYLDTLYPKDPIHRQARWVNKKVS